MGFIFAVLTAFYTGVLLWEMRGIPFWNTILIPLLFLTSALSTGIGAVLISSIAYNAWKKDGQLDTLNLHYLYKIDLLLIIIEVAILLIYLLVMGQSTHPAAVNSSTNTIDWLFGSSILDLGDRCWAGAPILPGMEPL